MGCTKYLGTIRNFIGIPRNSSVFLRRFFLLPATVTNKLSCGHLRYGYGWSMDRSTETLREFFAIACAQSGVLHSDDAVFAVQMAGCNPNAVEMKKIRGAAGHRNVDFRTYEQLVREYGGDLSHATFSEIVELSGLATSTGYMSLDRLGKVVAPRDGAPGKVSVAELGDLFDEGRRKGVVSGSGHSTLVEVKPFVNMLFRSDH